ncbi:M12 family metallo-peptidase [Rhodothermus marinus]|uniref:M12 family metallo-peptidase n=1 Tax=Rhodothermus marinus TaxID=29549 RepID=UPI000A79E0BF|nr:M12 family metallo-peptidase [Rhodothermus marinus]
MPLFEAVSASLQALGPQAQQRQQVLQKLPMVQQLQVVRLPAQLWRYRSFELAVNAAGRLVPGRGKGLGTLTVRRGELSVLSEEAVAWNGRIYVGTDTSEAVGEVSLVVLRTGAVTGQVLLGDAEYWVRPLGGGLHALVTIDPSKYPKERPASPYHDGGGGPGEAGLNDAAGSVQPEKAVEHETQAVSVGSCTQEETAALGAVVQARCSPEVVRVLVLYTPEAAQGRDIDGIIYAALNDANQAYRNSQINNLELRLVHKQSFNFTLTTNIVSDRENFITDPQAQALRDQYQADVVVLLMTQNYPDGSIGIAGGILSGQTGNQLRNIPEINQRAYALVHVDYATGSYYTLAHEIGHIQGARHHPEDDNYCCPEVGIPYGRGHRFTKRSCFLFFCDTDYYATVMAYTPDRMCTSGIFRTRM